MGEPENPNEAVRYVRALTAESASQPAWSPDGEWIVYKMGSKEDGMGNQITGGEFRLMRPDGSDDQHLYESDIADYDEIRRSTWSPDGSTIALQCGGMGTENICFVDVATGDVTESVEGEFPKWAN